jgi:hypothetical protein
MSYITKFAATAHLDQSTLEALAGLYLSNYDGTNLSLFKADLADKDEVLLLYSDDNLVGFTTFKTYLRDWNNQKIKILYSGDTIVDRDHWGQQALAFAWIGRMGEIKRQDPDIQFYWFLLVKGHRTFKYMPVFGKTFYPHWSIDRDELKLLATTLAEEKFGSEFNPTNGVVEFKSSRGHLKAEIANPSEEDMTKEAVQFFIERNPNYKNGHELVCICEMEEHNMKPLTKRLFRKSSIETPSVE